MHRIENCEKIKQDLQPKTTSDNGVASKKEICNQRALIKELSGAEQEMREKELQYEDGHDL